MKSYPVIFHGSENSLDRDAYVVVPEPMAIQEAKSLCEQYPALNANIITVDNGQVSWCYKGTIDECNNSILATYKLHQQIYKNPVDSPMERDYATKFLRTIRGLLSYNSRTEHRAPVKSALRSNDLYEKLDVLKNIDLTKIDDFGKKDTNVNAYKFFAFQLGQSRALLEDNVELFTKNKVSNYYPELASFLERRENSDPKKLQSFFQDFCDFCFENTKKVEKHDLYASFFNGKKQVFHTKTEKILPPVVIFDLDNTLFDETHRSHLRESEQWDDYFNLCHLDTPIEHVIQLTHDYKQKGYEIWIMSGRSENVLDKTIQSLENHKVAYDNIKLRAEDNFMPDYVLKPAWARNLVGLERIEAVYDDQPEVIKGFKKKNLNVIDVTTLSKKKDALKPR